MNDCTTSTTTSTPDEVRRIARDFLARTGMAPTDLAARIGYAYSTLAQFLANKYRARGSSESAICEAVLDFVGSRPPEVPDAFTGKLYEIGNTRAMRDVLKRLAEQPCIMLCYAPPGSGKTDVARALIPEYRRNGVEIRRIYCRAAMGRRDLMRRIAFACGSMADIGIERTIANLRYDYAGRRVVLYLDEAQHLSVECLETARELYDELRWSLCFAGSHQLERIFSKWVGDLEQLERRIASKITLPPVTAEEAAAIVRSELPQFNAAKTRSLIESAHVSIRADKSVERYLSIGRLMANIRRTQELLPEPADGSAQQQKVEAIA